MKKIIEVTGEITSIMGDDGNVMKVKTNSLGFIPKVGDEVEINTTGEGTFITKKIIKPPFYLMWWFIIIAYFCWLVPGILLTIARVQFNNGKNPKVLSIVAGSIALLLSLVSCVNIFTGSNSTTQQSSTKETVIKEEKKEEPKKEEPKKEEKKSYSVGEKAPILNRQSKEVGAITIDSAVFVEQNPYSDKQADRVVHITYTYENIALEDGLYVSDVHFKAYDNSGKALESYFILDGNKYPDTISTGRTLTATVTYALNDESNEIEIEYFQNMFDSKYDILFKISVQ